MADRARRVVTLAAMGIVLAASGRTSAAAEAAYEEPESDFSFRDFFAISALDAKNPLIVGFAFETSGRADFSIKCDRSTNLRSISCKNISMAGAIDNMILTLESDKPCTIVLEARSGGAESCTVSAHAKDRARFSNASARGLIVGSSRAGGSNPGGNEMYLKVSGTKTGEAANCTFLDGASYGLDGLREPVLKLCNVGVTDWVRYTEKVSKLDLTVGNGSRDIISEAHSKREGERGTGILTIQRPLRAAAPASERVVVDPGGDPPTPVSSPNSDPNTDETRTQD